MNGFIKRTAAALCLGGLAVCSGCCKDGTLADCYDNCWLERNAYQAHRATSEAFGAQVNNGHVLDQTIFTYDFELGTDKLTKGGQEHLAYLARRLPEPDCKIYLQTAQDVDYDPTAPEQFNSTRTELDSKRVAAIQRFLSADSAGRQVAFQVAVHDAPTPGLYSAPIANAFARHVNNFQGSLPTAANASSSGNTSGGVSSGGGGSSTPR